MYVSRKKTKDTSNKAPNVAQNKKTGMAWANFWKRRIVFFPKLRCKLGLPFERILFKDMKKTSSTDRRSAPARTAEAFFMSLKRILSKGRSPN